MNVVLFAYAKGHILESWCAIQETKTLSIYKVIETHSGEEYVRSVK